MPCEAACVDVIKTYSEEEKQNNATKAFTIPTQWHFIQYVTTRTTQSV